MSQTDGADRAAKLRNEVVGQNAAKIGQVEGVKAPPTLPGADGRRFSTLDAYLEHLRRYAAPMDRPWYREISPGLYRLETANLHNGSSEQTFTRAELMKRFGFDR